MIVYQKKNQRISRDLEEMLSKEAIEFFKWKQHAMAEVCLLIQELKALRFELGECALTQTKTTTRPS